jgi:iron(III) transport system substrate-binding protein
LSLLAGTKKPAGTPDDIKFWIPDNTEFDDLRDAWVKEWDALFGYRK